ncbi:hypothetical protein Golax_016466, partial [Gossypium laxum]|nr:hypothetical protein [Gossypium laxum]
MLGVIGPIKVNLKERFMRGFPLIKISRSGKLFLFDPFKFFNITCGLIRDLLTRHNFPFMYEAVSACLESPKPTTEDSTFLTGTNPKHP